MESSALIPIFLIAAALIAAISLAYHFASVSAVEKNQPAKDNPGQAGVDKPAGGAILIVKDINIGGTHLKDLQKLIESKHPGAKVTCYTLEEFAKGAHHM